METELDRTAKVEFWIASDTKMFALRRLYYVPRVGETCVFNDVMRPVIAVTWCMDRDATERGIKVQVTLGDEL